MRWTCSDVKAGLPSPAVAKLPRFAYTGSDPSGCMLAVASMAHHMTDEGWQIALALQHAGYVLQGHGVEFSRVHVPQILQDLKPGVVVVQDKREWDPRRGDFRDPAARFTGVEALAERSDVFKLTVLKDAHQQPQYHRSSAEEIGCHAHIVYYAEPIVRHLAPWLGPVVRTYHTIDAAAVPAYSADGRTGAIISGALSDAYPLRMRLVKDLRDVHHAKHPGYHRRGCATPEFLRTLSRFKVAVCTASRYGYALRKIMEATACGCAVVTDLPADDPLPEIDGNLLRVHNGASSREVWDLVQSAAADYSPEKQRRFAELATARYDYTAEGLRLAAAVELLRRSQGGR